GRGGPCRCARRQDLTAGFLNAEERFTWTGALPVEPLDRVAAMMDRVHFRAVERSVFGLMRCRLEVDRVDCFLLGRWPALLFAEPETRVAGNRVTRTWRIKGGLLARPDPPVFGTITFGWESGGESASQQEVWVRVE